MPRTYIYKKYPKRPNLKLFGIEIETSNRIELNYLPGCEAIVKEDASINGIEIVTFPLPPNRLKKKIEKIYSRYNIDYDYKCGIHIHVNNRFLGDIINTYDKIYKIINFLYDIYTDHPDLYKLLFGRLPNKYCTVKLNDHNNHHSFIHLTNNTIEFRMFSSGDKDWAIYCVNIVEALMNFKYPEDITTFKTIRKFLFYLYKMYGISY